MAAAAGDTAAARRLLSALRALPTTRLAAHGNTVEFIEALIAARGARWGDVVALIAQPARDGSDRGDSRFDRLGAAPERWLVAQAYERLGQPDSAVAFYDRLLAPGALSLTHSFARLRLVMLYARMGRAEAAERHFAVLERDCTNPDPDVRRLLDEARAAVRSARGMTKSATVPS
jgi:hypothetical protein